MNADISDEQIESYRENGALVIEGFLSPQEFSALPICAASISKIRWVSTC